MYTIHGLSISSNTTKIIYVAEALNINYQYVTLDLSKGEHKAPEHLQRHPLGKLPTLTHNNETLFESNAICCYLADIEGGALYPENELERAKVQQWLAFFTNHLGRWFNSYAFEKVAKIKFGLGTPNKAAEEEALGFIKEQLPAINKHLAVNDYLIGDAITIADCVAFAYFENAEMASFSLDEFPEVLAWYQGIKASEFVVRGHKKLHGG